MRPSSPAPKPQTQSDGKLLRKGKSLRAPESVWKEIDDRAKTASVGNARNPHVIRGILPCVGIAKQNGREHSLDFLSW